MNSLGRAFNRMWGASLITNLADGVLATAAPLLAVSLTSNPLLISALSAFVMLPWLIFAIPIGVIVDKFDRRHLIAGANGVRFLIAGLIALSISTHVITIYLLFLATFIIGLCEVIADTSSQALIPQILESQHYEKANSRLQISETVIQGFVGTPISGFLYAIAIFLPFAINSTGFFIAAIFALSIPTVVKQELTSEEPISFISEMKFGAKYILEHKQLLRIVLTTTSIGFCYSLSSSTSVLFILKEMHLEKSLFGVLLSIQGLGAVAGGLLCPLLSKRFSRQRILMLAITASSILILMQSFSPNIYVYGALITIGAFAMSNWNVLLMASYQDLIPTHLFGKIHGTRRTLVWGLMPFGSLLGGVIANYGLRLPLFIGGLISTIIAIFSIKFFLNFAKTESVPGRS